MFKVHKKIQQNGITTVNFDHISQIFLVFLLLTKCYLVGAIVQKIQAALGTNELTRFISMISFYTPLKCQKTKG